MTIHRIARFGLVNAYLVEEEDGLTLVDTMLPRSEKQILAAAQALGAPIRRIVLTHAHGDHIGSLDALAAALPDARVSCPLDWDEVPDCEPAELRIDTVPRRLADRGDPSADIDEHPGSLDGLLALAARDEEG